MTKRTSRIDEIDKTIASCREYRKGLDKIGTDLGIVRDQLANADREFREISRINKTSFEKFLREINLIRWILGLMVLAFAVYGALH